MTFESRKLGQVGEGLAVNFLQQKKLRILATNLRTKFGEIDILAADGQTIAVVEVKTKTDAHRGAAIEMITPAKQRKLVLLTQELQMKYQTDNVRVDVVTVDNAAAEPVLKYYKGIIEYNG